MTLRQAASRTMTVKTVCSTPMKKEVQTRTIAQKTYSPGSYGRRGSDIRGGEIWEDGRWLSCTVEAWHKSLALEGPRSPTLTVSTYSSFRSTFWQSPCPSVCLEPVLGQLAARYHYLLDSGQSNLSACSCFIELDKYNMWLTAIIYYRTALFIQQAEAFGAFKLASLSLMELHSSDGSLWTVIHGIRTSGEISATNWIFHVCKLVKLKNQSIAVKSTKSLLSPNEDGW